jgi:hypothetical protein
MKIRPMGPELFRVDRWTDRQTDRHVTKLTVACRNCANARKKIYFDKELVAYIRKHVFR